MTLNCVVVDDSSQSKDLSIVKLIENHPSALNLIASIVVLWKQKWT